MTSLTAAVGLLSLFMAMIPSALSSGSSLAAQLAAFQSVKPDANEFYTHSVDYEDEQGKYLKMEFRGRFKPNTMLHSLDTDEQLQTYDCNTKQVGLDYGSSAIAQTMAQKFRGALAGDDGNKDTLLTGSSLWKCPPVEPPKEVREDRKGNAVNRRFKQGVRRVASVQIDAADPSRIILITTYASLASVFEDLDLSGETNLLGSDGPSTGHTVNIGSDVEAAVQTEVLRSQGGERGKQRKVADDKCCKRLKKLGQKIKNVFKKPVFKKIGNFFKKTFKRCGKGRAGQCALDIFKTIVNVVPKIAGKLLPTLVNYSKTLATNLQFSMNYDSRARRAKEMWVIDTKGLQMGPYFDFGPPNKQNNQNQVSVLVAGQLTCSNCFIRFYNGRVSFSLKIGGGTFGSISLQGTFDFELMIELIATISIVTQITIPGPEVPVLGFGVGPPGKQVTIGLTLAPEVSVGVQLSLTDFYYYYHATGQQTAGFSLNFGRVPSLIHSGKFYGKPKTIGPVVKGASALSLYVLPLCGLVLFDVAAVEAGVQPTFTFNLIPQPKGATCALKWGVGFDAPIVVGGWVGLETPFGMWRLAGWSMAFSVLPLPANFVSGCVAKSDVTATARFGVAIPAVEMDEPAAAQFEEALTDVGKAVDAVLGDGKSYAVYVGAGAAVAVVVLVFAVLKLRGNKTKDEQIKKGDANTLVDYGSL